MCGKLEELPHNQRTLYFHSFENTTFSVHNQPKFQIAYKLVDHCYNVTFIEQNGTFVIQPTQLALKCHLKIFLPFGNEIKLKLRFTDDAVSKNNASASANDPNIFNEQIKKSEGNFNYKDLTFDEFSMASDNARSHNEANQCAGVLVEMVNHLNEKWVQCVTKVDNRIEYTLASPDNVLLIRITKLQEYNKLASSSKSVISLEYSALPVESIVSQCAFGWILIGQFCMSTFNKKLTWQSAEEFCIDLGGHLPSIHNDDEQHLIDMVLFNRQVNTSSF